MQMNKLLNSRNTVFSISCGCYQKSTGLKIRKAHAASWPDGRIVKKDVSKGLAKVYDPHAVESDWYSWWESQGYFKPRKGGPRTFSMLLPPPNVTGTLHLGHALTCSVQDVIARWRRMEGDSVVWIPGSDHAGIATQAVVERYLGNQAKGTHISRENLVEEAWNWRRNKGSIIMAQLRQLGASLDWSREYFTLDGHQSKAVCEAFIHLYKAGLVYREETLINWSCTLRSAIADVEVDWLELSGPTLLRVPGYEKPVQFGTLTHVALQLVGEPGGEIIVATSRLETMLGDVAVAVHPDDERYSAFIGRHVIHPLREHVTLPIIADTFVDPAFGTGAVKITPAHDAIDFEVARRHNLPVIPVIAEDGKITQQWEHFAGKGRFEAREAIMEQLQLKGLVRGTSPLASSKIPICSRSGDVIELLLRPQWFIKCKDMAAEAMEAVKSSKLVIDPPVFEKVWFDWLTNIRDWCISRQLWWGHRIPAYLCSSDDGNSEDKIWLAAHNEEEAHALAAKHFQSSKLQIVQDTDVLDTWFSSALLPISSLGWPDTNADDYKYYMPLDVMETGHDILFFWVARMVMLSSKLTGCLPFKKILLHGIVCDARGRKMSKSLGNVIHPEDVIHGTSLENLLVRVKEAQLLSGASNEEVKRALDTQRSTFPEGVPMCGTDALRFTLVSHNVKSHNVTFDIGECYTNKLFCNKIWQAARFFLGALSQPSSESFQAGMEDGLVEKWILSRLSNTVRRIKEALEKSNFHEATSALKEFIYSQFCDVYLECSKPSLKNELHAGSTIRTLTTCFITSLQLLAPFMPYISEEIYQNLPRQLRKHDSIHQSDFPSVELWDERVDMEAEKNMEVILSTVYAIRRLKLEAGVTKLNTKVTLVMSDNNEFNLLQEYCWIPTTLAACHTITVGQVAVTESSIFEVVSPSCTVHLLGQHINSKTNHKYDKLQKEIDKLLTIVSAQGFKEKAPEKVQLAHTEKLERLQAEMKRLNSVLNKKDH